jgi:DNA topoisomerase-3
MLVEVPTVLDALLATDPGLRPVIETLDRTQRSRAWNDSKITAHHGIIPTLEPANMSAMSDAERAVYRLIRSHYLAQFRPHHEYERTVVQLTCADVTLQARGKLIKVEGWRSVLDDVREHDDNNGSGPPSQVPPPLASGTRCAVAGVELKTLKTLPPKPYTQGELVKAMKGVARLVSDPRLKQKLKDTTGIGTEATRAGIIQGLIGRGYLLKKGRAVRASQTAFTLIDAIPGAIADPGTTAIWEQALDLIAAGQLSLEDFVGKQSAWVAQLVREHSHASLTIQAPGSPPCPLCKSAMRQRTGKQGAFWSCTRYPDCKGTLPLGNPRHRRRSP